MRRPRTGLQRSLLLSCPLVLSVVFSLGCRPGNAEFVRVTADTVALIHIRVIDGTGAPAKDDQTIIIQSGVAFNPLIMILAPCCEFVQVSDIDCK
jgi:hypothetical protein